MGNLFSALTPVQKRSLAALTFAIVILTVGAVVWVVKAGYQPISLNSVQQSASLIEKFEQNNLDYKYTADGQILVNQDQLGKSQLLLEQTRGASFSSHGLELFDKTDYGMTEHAQKVTFQRAMQGELERTLSSLSYIKYARVHLTMADKKLFSSDSTPAKASVTLFTEQDHEISDKNISGVQSLIAAAIEGLEAEHVTVFSQNGKQLSRTTDSSDEQELLVGSATKEAELTKKVEKLLGLYMEPSQYAVSVTVRLNLQKVSSVEKSVLVGPNGEGVVVRKKTSSRDVPNVDGSGEDTKEQFSEELEYSVGSKTQQSTQLAGDVERVSIAIALVAELNEQQISKLKTLVTSAVGLDAVRGDSIAIEYFEPLFADTEVQSTVNAVVADNLPQQTTIKPLKTSGNMLISSIPAWAWWLAPALLIILTVVLVRRQRLPHKEREAVLLEVSDWLNKKEPSNAR
ncbi:flagellar M-ring protein FliF [Pseudoalteromonas sp. BMB]|uniref:flagellar basal-body MS-ring/collar protein FliF n=1 Tax=Pseudoalteromonas sp. BMB TaxID=1874619 RepID=UPI00083D7D0E|nr:flagellar basal-body MS-ring/collar protein FliF [Pseudoalteromonas sp. BMB]ODB37096.1 flagellar M-ring protein FliF [Pseudoalteromonas sp. BMB]